MKHKNNCYNIFGSDGPSVVCIGCPLENNIFTGINVLMLTVNKFFPVAAMARAALYCTPKFWKKNVNINVQEVKDEKFY